MLKKHRRRGATIRKERPDVGDDQLLEEAAFLDP
jgi:hypothetical protein